MKKSGQALRRAQAPPRHSRQRSISQSVLRTHQLTQREVPGRGSADVSREANKDRGARPGPEGPRGRPAEHMWNRGQSRRASVRLEGRPAGRTDESRALDQQAKQDGTTALRSPDMLASGLSARHVRLLYIVLQRLQVQIIASCKLRNRKGLFLIFISFVAREVRSSHAPRRRLANIS